MNVARLIEHLRELDPRADVYIGDSETWNASLDDVLVDMEPGEDYGGAIILTASSAPESE